MHARAMLLCAVLASCESTSSLGSASTPAKAITRTAPSVRVAIGPDSASIDATTIVGKRVPAWELDWLDAKPIEPDDLRGQVVLVRWFTEGCHWCGATAPTLVALDAELAAKGLRVVGVYHHKSDAPLERSRVRALAERFGFRFPIAIDHDWRTLRRWWLDDHEGWTSISLLIDRRGIVRFVHTGGSYAPGSEDAAQMRRWIDQLLAEPPPPA